MHRVYSWFMWLFEQLLILIIAALTLVVVVGVFFRYVLSDALPWTDELAGFLLVWVTWLGAVTALERGKHISFDGLNMVLSKRAARALEVFSELFLFAFLAALSYNGFLVCVDLMNQTTVTMPIPAGIVYSIMPVSGVLMMIVLIYRWIVPRDFATGLDAEVEEALTEAGH